jgi:class 3 adenylate cyclase
LPTRRASRHGLADTGNVRSLLVQPVPDADQADALVRRNFAFIDLCGFTMLTDERGVGEAVAALSTFRAVVRERAGWRGVRVAKWLGDGAMLVATEPRPILDAVIRMEEALDLRGCPLPLRGGVAAGRVILFEGDDYIGRPVNLAARLCDEAEPHQLLVTASLYEAAGEGLSARRLGPHRIRGFTRPVEVVDLSQGDHRVSVP